MCYNKLNITDLAGIALENKKNNDQLKSEIIAGRNAVNEALNSNMNIDKLFVAGKVTGSAVAIVAKCRERGIVIKQVSDEKLNYMCGNVNHQGVAASVAAVEYATVDDILKKAEDSGKPPFIVICDEIEDPHNLGAIIRTAEVMGADGVIIPKHRNATLTTVVAKTSAGALMYIPVARVTNIARTVDELKQKGLWIYGAEMSQQSCYDTDFSGGVCLVVGSEGRGISRIVKEKCDFLVSIPMYGNVNSLNASVAAGILMSEISRQRNK